ncbi:uncharacterized protein LOC129613143 [Condylostylus longicornis]|uniref:uncharacterized protein LOC129613143 n=1 Tax=Condylostylus longicornis TaxID=2530218 RepID=UPI00244DE9E2|nr:uncharacterized protein LOC129613143 [Condylostylus longicornis]
MTQFVELDFQLENEVLEWSEEYNIDNEALFALIKILKSRWPSPNSFNKNLKTDRVVQCDYSEIFLDTVNSIGNGSLREYLEDLKHNQKAILNELKFIRNETDFENENGSVTSKNDFTENEKLLRFPIESLNHFQSLEEICSRNEKLYKKMIEIFLSNEKVEHGISIQEFLTINFKMILEKKLMLYLAKFFINVYQLESCSIFKCLKDAFLQKFPKENGEQIFSSILMYFKNLLINEEDSILATESISAEETNVEEHLSIDLELISLDLPCNTIKDLFKFEEQCKELNFALISLFKSGPKNDWKSLIFFVMKKVFGQNIISEIEWETANDNKVEVKYLNIIEALVKYVIENFEEVTCEDDIAKIVTEWIKLGDTLKQHENKLMKRAY